MAAPVAAARMQVVAAVGAHPVRATAAALVLAFRGLAVAVAALARLATMHPALVRRLEQMAGLVLHHQSQVRQSRVLAAAAVVDMNLPA